MIRDAKTIPAGDVLDCHVCIVGAGPAGISLALELMQSGLRIILLEAGGERRAGRSQELYRGHVDDLSLHVPLHRDRYRQLGGTSRHWGGRCAPFDPIDFEQRGYVPFSGWPLTYAEMLPYYRRAHVYCECGAYSYRARDALPGLPPSAIEGLDDGDVVADTIERWSPPTDFGAKYSDRLKSSTNLCVLVNAICLEIENDPDGRTAKALRVSTFARNEFRIEPRFVVLAGGGLETTRLLLASNRIHRAGIGNHSDWLGRSYMCQIAGKVAQLVLDRSAHVNHGYERDTEGIYCRRRLLISEAAQRKHALLNIYMLLDTPPISDAQHGSGFLSLAYIYKRLRENLTDVNIYALVERAPSRRDADNASASQPAQPGDGRAQSQRAPQTRWSAHLGNVIKGVPEIMMLAPQFAWKRFVSRRRIPSIIMPTRHNRFWLHFHAEQAPNRDSRVTLSADRDEFDVPRLSVQFRASDLDIDSIYKTHQLLDAQCRKTKLGRVEFLSKDPKEDIRALGAVPSSHLGTARMAKDPSEGVVDENCRVHGIGNLFVASSAVFATSGQSHPTLSIVALAIRLADHLTALAEWSSLIV